MIRGYAVVAGSDYAIVGMHEEIADGDTDLALQELEVLCSN
jgi:hypothetical protein